MPSGRPPTKIYAESAGRYEIRRALQSVQQITFVLVVPAPLGAIPAHIKLALIDPLNLLDHIHPLSSISTTSKSCSQMFKKVLCCVDTVTSNYK